MAQMRNGRTGRRFFIAAVLIVFAAIIGTALGANDLRNFNLVLARFGYPPVSLEQLLSGDTFGLTGLESAKEPPVRIVKGVRLPAPTIQFPTYGRVDMRAPPAKFARAIRKDPRALCEALRAIGFTDILWTASAFDGQGSECSSFRKIGNGASDEEQSSVFVSLKGDQQDRVSSFRVKLNIESEADRSSVLTIGSQAVAVFLRQVQWQDDGDILQQVEALQEFDRDDFGSHILLKREFGDLPRYNFFARQSKQKSRTIGDSYFDTTAWLPLSDAGAKRWIPKSALVALPLPGPIVR